MPFTFSHPVIVIPLHKLFNRYFNLTALIIGSMSPDFEYFITPGKPFLIEHSFTGIFLFNLPLTILISYIFHNIIKKQILIHLPHKIIKNYTGHIPVKIIRFRVLPFKKSIVFCYSAITEIFSHLFWDSFTHYHGFFVQNLSLLRISFKINNQSYRLYNILQHLSTIAGLIITILLLSTYKKTRSNFESHIFLNDKLKFWSYILLLSLFFFFFLLLIQSNLFIWYIVIYLLSSFLFSLIFVSTIYFLKNEVI